MGGKWPLTALKFAILTLATRERLSFLWFQTSEGKRFISQLEVDFNPGPVNLVKWANAMIAPLCSVVP